MWSAQIENPQLFWTIVAAIGQAAGSIATAAAVIVSLWIALSERRIKLRVKCYIGVIAPGDGSGYIDVVSINITNESYRRASIINLGWRTGWTNLRWAPHWLKYQFAIQMPSAGSPRPPLDLEPGQTTTVWILADDFRKATLHNGADFFLRKPPWRRRQVPTKIECVVSPTVDKEVKVRVDSSLERFLATGEIDNGARHMNEKAKVRRSGVKLPG